jgi:branched-chain amino acid transport system ATP-binding protein
MTALVEAKGLSAGYGEVQILNGIDLEVHAGEIVVLLGPNGVGKTTTLLTLAGEIEPLAGTVQFSGCAPGAPLHRRARAGLSYVTEERSVIMSLTTAQNLRLGRCKIEHALEMFPELGGLLHRRAGLLSGGEQQMLSLGRALARHPRVFFGDELSLGLAPIVVDRLLGAVRQAADNGVGCLIVEQHVHRALDIADRVYLLQKGKVEFAGTAAQARANRADIETSYLSRSSPVERSVSSE